IHPSGPMTHEWMIPVHISVSIGTPVVQPTGRRESDRAAARRIRARASEGDVAIESVDAFKDKFSIESLKKGSFNWRAALSLALASRLGYSAAVEVKATAREVWSFDECEFVEADDTQCFVAASTEVVVLSFRGTEAVGDWLSNLNTLGTTRPYGRVHRGFLAAF